jgi:peptide/nickel transport system permease protein
MSTNSVVIPYGSARQTLAVRRPRNPFAEFFRRVVRNRAALAGGIVLMVIILVAIFAPLVAPYAPTDQNFADYLSPPSPTHLFGTDEQGRDGLSRVIYGSRISLWIGVIAVSIAVTGGLFFGLLAGYFGGRTDSLVMRGMDIMLAFPEILLALAVVAVLGPALTTVMIAVGIASIPYYTRLVRSSVLVAKQAEYISAARVIGCPASQIVIRHIMPNSLAPVLVLATTGVAAAIITGAALSFLGLGVQPPTPEWGSMLSVSRNYLQHAPWMATFPGLAIMITVVAINLLGDGVRDALDPRLK